MFGIANTIIFFKMEKTNIYKGCGLKLIHLTSVNPYTLFAAVEVLTHIYAWIYKLTQLNDNEYKPIIWWKGTLG